ncbi:glyoxalase [Flavobacterium sp. Sd200]|uniref:VOC family protein n=1 Tax=Flavobacterium sp. Sd200 TaxID=2692211 RepID=UPI0013682802|nr:VOC family protein [Flavobacterium sp. Sd200]MXN91253.1 glyoxalase [Flavobacterium sp. Sd200]
MKTNIKSNQKIQASAIALMNLVLFFSNSENISAQNTSGIIGVDHVGINVPDFKTAMPFFTEVLGFVPVTQLGPIPLDAAWKEQNRINANTGALTIKMINAGTGASIEIFEYANNKGSLTNPNTDDIGASHIAFYTADINASVKYLKSKGVKVLGEPFTTPSGDTAGESWVYFETPWGSKMELVSYPNGKGYQKGNPKTILWSPKDEVAKSKPNVTDTATSKLLIEHHLEIWNEKDAVKRAALMGSTYAANIEMVDRHFIATGNDEIAGFVAKLQHQNPDFRFTAKSVEAHHNIVRLYWQFGSKTKPSTVTGMDLFVIENNKVQKLYVFVDETK